MAVYRHWSQLPSELLDLILHHIVSVSDFIRFRAVCTSWRSAAEPPKLRHQPPVLLLPYDASSPYRSFFSPVTRRAHHLYLPQLRNKRILSTSHGWMLLLNVKTNQLSLHNPVGLYFIQLPPVAAGCFKTPIRFGILTLDVFDLFVVLIPCGDGYSVMRRMMFCKMGDELWSDMQTDLDYDDAPIICHKGIFYSNSWDFIYAHEDHVAFSDQSEPEHYPEIYDLELFYDGNIAYIGDDDLSMYDGSFEDIHELLTSYGTVVYCGRIVKDYPNEEYPDETISFQKDFPNYKENCVYSTRRFREHYEGGGGGGGGKEKEEDDFLRPVIGILDIKDLTTDVMPCGEFYGFSEEAIWITLSFV